MDDQISDLKSFAEALTALAITTLRSQLERLSLEIKHDGSPVTSADIAIEKALRQRIEEHYPEHGILGEEFGRKNLEAEWVWVVDPIDGTRQFAAGLPNYGVLIALCRNGKPTIGVICQPLLRDVYLGVVGEGTWLNGKLIRTRGTETLHQAIACLSDPDAYHGTTADGFRAIQGRSHWNVYDGGCLGFAALAAGRLDLSLCGPTMDAFDICALVPVVEGAGGLITDWKGGNLTLSSQGEIVASATPALHAKALEILTLPPPT